jgi:integrase
MASLYKRGSTWWAKSYERGKMVRVSLKTTDKAEAKRRMKGMVDRVPRTLSSTKDVPSITWETAAQDLLAYYRTYGTRNPVEAGYKIKHLTTYFTGMPLDSIDSQAVTGYVSHRRAQGMAAATINVELSTLRRALRLAVEHGKLGQVPVVRMLRPPAPRSGFFERDQFERIARALPDDLALVVRIGYVYGWRIKSEVLALTKSQVDLDAGTLRLEPGSTKNRDGRVVYLTDELKVALADQLARVRAIEREMGIAVPWVFPHLRGYYWGQRRREFYRSWRTACRKAGQTGALLHDLRRSAARHMVGLGILERVVMKVAGWKTRSMLDRYHIVSPGDLQDVARRLSDNSRHNLGTGDD